MLQICYYSNTMPSKSQISQDSKFWPSDPLEILQLYKASKTRKYTNPDVKSMIDDFNLINDDDPGLSIQTPVFIDTDLIQTVTDASIGLVNLIESESYVTSPSNLHHLYSSVNKDKRRCAELKESLNASKSSLQSIEDQNSVMQCELDTLESEIDGIRTHNNIMTSICDDEISGLNYIKTNGINKVVLEGLLAGSCDPSNNTNLERLNEDITAGIQKLDKFLKNVGVLGTDLENHDNINHIESDISLFWDEVQRRVFRDSWHCLSNVDDCNIENSILQNSMNTALQNL